MTELHEGEEIVILAWLG